MLDDHFDARARGHRPRARRAARTPSSRPAQAAADFIAALQSEPEWNRLFFEFAVYAARNEAFREQFVARTRAMRARIAELLERRVARARHRAAAARRRRSRR